jgi:hypothetical protein
MSDAVRKKPRRQAFLMSREYYWARNPNIKTENIVEKHNAGKSYS